jgi:hypothetical protein
MNITAGELFDPETLSLINDRSEYYVKEVVSAYLGRCYTLCHKKNMTLADCIVLKLNTSWDQCYKTFYGHHLQMLIVN